MKSESPSHSIFPEGEHEPNEKARPFMEDGHIVLRQSAEQSLAEARDAAVVRLDKTAEDREGNDSWAAEYASMMTPESQAQIEQSTGVNPAWLLAQERSYFFQFVRQSDEAEKEEIKKFFAEFSLSGIRAFTILDYDKSYGDDLLRFGREKPEFARELFQIFDIALDQINDLSAELGQALNGSGVLEPEEARVLSDQLNEAFLRKAKDVVVAAMHAGDHEIKEADVIGSLKGMLVGISTLNEFLSKNPAGSFETLPMPAGQMPQFLYTDISGRHYRLKFNIRERAEEKAQARINFELFFDTDIPNVEIREVFQQETQWLDNPKRTEPQKESVFRMGIDLDTFHAEPSLSLDVGRAALSSDRRVATGDKLGNILKAVSHESIHTPDSFDKRFTDPDTFAGIAGSFRQYLEQRSVETSLAQN